MANNDNISVLMSGPSLSSEKLRNICSDVIAVSNTFDINSLKCGLKKLNKIYYFISDPTMVLNREKQEILKKNMEASGLVILVVPYRFLRYAFIFNLFLSKKYDVRFYRDNLKSYRRLDYKFTTSNFPNLQSIVVDAVIPYLIKYERKDIVLYGVDLNYGCGAGKAYGQVVKTAEENDIDGRTEWAEFVCASIMFYKAIARRHYNIKITYDMDCGLREILKKYANE